MIRIKQKVQFYRDSEGRHRIDANPSDDPPPAPVMGRVPRIARLMALAIRFDQLLREGKVVSQSELARLTHVTQPRMTQIMNLLHLAPDIQEAILFLPRTTSGRDPIHEKMLRTISAEVDWGKQREMWDFRKHGTKSQDSGRT